jgi:NADH:ubiquinone oxidoreductase subunit 6 (subunit J)
MIFDIFSILALLFSILIVFFSNPIYSIFSLILSFFCSIIILFFLKIEFLSLVYLLVYIGAIPILFLFILLMFPTYNNINLNKIYIKNMNLYLFILIKLYLLDLYYLWHIPLFSFWRFSNYKTSSLDYCSNFYNDINVISNLLYTYYFVLFFAIGLLLFFTMIGAIVIILNKHE